MTKAVFQDLEHRLFSKQGKPMRFRPCKVGVSKVLDLLPRQRDQTVFSYAERIVNHEQPHLKQIEALLQSLR